MKTDSRIIISIDKQFYSDDDEIRIYVWFYNSFYSPATLTVLNPTGRKIDSSRLKTDAETTETFAFTCGGPFMFENGYYTIKVECENAVSETMFEYYNTKNRFEIHKFTSHGLGHLLDVDEK
ncbi:MAG: hypothetical protein OEM28_00845 [Nitrosopumilus sp.]|nr:hypothetical protein [Nitrosopumilus sp.]MDH3486411.1 hypothetical protein [Nitrosopumilus sp.]